MAEECEDLYQPPGLPLTILDRPSREEISGLAVTDACTYVLVTLHRYNVMLSKVVQENDAERSGRDEVCKSVLNEMNGVSYPTSPNDTSSFAGAPPTIDLRLSESRDAICAALLVVDPMVVDKTNQDDISLR